MKLARAQKLAEKIAAELAPLCERIAIAGSIRRQRPEVGDIDLVILPKISPKSIKLRCQERCRVLTHGEQNFICALRLAPGQELQLDIFFAQPATQDLLEARPGNFGSLLLCRTGSKEHNIFLVEHAKLLGLRWNPYHGVFDGHGQCLAWETEQDIFAALQMDFIPPERRER